MKEKKKRKWIIFRKQKKKIYKKIKNKLQYIIY